MGCGVGLLLLVWGLALLAWAQYGWSAGPPWLELTRYLPFYLWLAATALAFVAAIWLRGWWLLFPVAAFAIVLVVIMDVELNVGEAAAPGAIPLRVMTYNIKASDAGQRRGGIEWIGAAVVRHNPDIALMQDADGLLITRGAEPLSGGPPVFGLSHVFAVGQFVVASRYPIERCGTGKVDFSDISRRYLHCDVDVLGRKVRFVSVHLQTPRAGLAAARRKGLEGLDEWERNYEERIVQARRLVSDLAGMPRPLVVVGDFNAPMSSPVMRTIVATGLRDCHDIAGRGWGFTYGASYRWNIDFLRIDHILASGDVGMASCRVGDDFASPHRPVIADLWLLGEGAPPSKPVLAP
jgi:endonuclease/exonuclease/phosphatase family metal-dependent hydrolase